jgi:hypothetical protein
MKRRQFVKGTSIATLGTILIPNINIHTKEDPYEKTGGVYIYNDKGLLLRTQSKQKFRFDFKGRRESWLDNLKNKYGNAPYHITTAYAIAEHFHYINYIRNHKKLKQRYDTTDRESMIYNITDTNWIFKRKFCLILTIPKTKTYEYEELKNLSIIIKSPTISLESKATFYCQFPKALRFLINPTANLFYDGERIKIQIYS